VSMIKATATPRRVNDTVTAIRTLASQLTERLGGHPAKDTQAPRAPRAVQRNPRRDA
jgi:hypothetical protein